MSAAMIDAHLHLWDLQRSAYSWITPEHGPLHTTITADRAAGELAAVGVERAVLVQAEDSLTDTEFMLEVAAGHDWVAGVVGWVQLDDPAVAAAQLDRFAADPAFCGVRHLVHDDPRDDFLAIPAVRTSLRMLAECGLPFDVPDAWPRHLAATAELAGALPGLTVVLDHLGKPPWSGMEAGGAGEGSPDFLAWREAFAAVAARPNTVAKVSGLQVRDQPFTAELIRPCWETALELFGPDRLLWGSDWPMTLLTAGYAGTWEVMAELVGKLTPEEQSKILAGTAERVYRLAEPTTANPPDRSGAG